MSTDWKKAWEEATLFANVATRQGAGNTPIVLPAEVVVAIYTQLLNSPSTARRPELTEIQADAANSRAKAAEKALRKAVKFAKVRDAVEEHIAAHDLRNGHYLRDDEVIAAISWAKPKHVKRALKELR